MSLVESISADVLRELTEHGQAVVLMSQSDRWYDPTTGGYTPTPDDRLGHESVGLLLDYENSGAGDQAVLRKSRKCIVSAVGLDRPPVAGDKLCVDPVGEARIFNVVQVKSHEMGGTYFAHLLHLRIAS